MARRRKKNGNRPKRNGPKKQLSAKLIPSTPTNLCTAVVDEQLPQKSPYKESVEKKKSKVPFATKMWLIFGVGISLSAIVAASLFDMSFGATITDIIDKRFSDFILAILAISSSVINIIIDIKAEIDINSKVNYAIFPVISGAFSLAYYSFLYGKNNELAFLKWNWVLPIALAVLAINIFIGFVLTSKEPFAQKEA